METTLAQSIRRLRKEKKMTQEQLSEVLGVTAGAVYKWEAGLSVPELALMMDMADFFDVSMDALVGRKIKDNSLEATLRRMAAYCRERNPEALNEAEKLLKKYPASFDAVHGCAQVFQVFGIGSGGREASRRALELFGQARLLLPQNTDPKISETILIGEIAGVHLLLGEYEKSAEILRNHNAGGIYSDAIGLLLALHLKRPGEAASFLSEALLTFVMGLFNTVTGFALVFLAEGDSPSAEAILTWAMETLEGLKNRDTCDFTDKCMAVLLTLRTHIQTQNGDEAGAWATLLDAARLSRQFDAAPNYGLSSLKYIQNAEDHYFFDALGATATESVETLLKLLGNQQLTDMWKEAASNA